MNPLQQEKLAKIQADEQASKEAAELRYAKARANELSPWSGPEAKADLEQIVEQQRQDNPRHTTREMLMLTKINNAEKEQQGLQDKSDGIHRNAEGESIIPRADELAQKWERHQSQTESDTDYKMKPEELSEYQILLMTSQPKTIENMTRGERMEAATAAAERGDMDEYKRIRRASKQ